MKVDGSISSLIQGVSQQPQRERLPGQCTLQENCSSDPVNGLTRRGAMEYIANMINSSNEYVITNYDAGSLGEFIIAHRAGDIRVFDLDGSEYTVNISGSAGDYLTDDKMLYIGIDDTIYVGNSETTIASTSGNKTYADKASIVFLLGGQYARSYKVTVKWGANTLSKTYTTPDGSVSGHATNIATNFIATQLESQLNADSTFTTNFTVSRADDVLLIESDVVASEDFEVTVEDGDGGANMFVVNNGVPDVGELPRYAPHGYYVKVEENGTADVDDWYLEFVSDTETTIGDGFGTEGVWVETVAPDVDYQLDAATMPHKLVKETDGTFTFQEGEWEDRRVGDDKTNPMPSFVGHTLNSMQAFQGRLVFLADVNIVMSRTDELQDFFKQSATTLADSDPIDISSSIGTYILRDAVPHNRDLVVFSDSAQFIVFGRNALTPKNTSLVLTTEFDADLSATPVGAGRGIFFAYKYGNFSNLQEFFTDGSSDINDARGVTQHVLQYIKGQPTQLLSTTNFNKVLVRTNDDSKVIYVYEYIWVNNEKAQSSWSKWTFNRDVKHMFFVDNLLYAIMKSGNNYDLMRLDLDVNDDAGVTYRIEVDDKIKRESVNTTFTVPYDIDDIENYVAVQGLGCPHPGLKVPITSLVGSTVTLSTDMEGGDIYFGRKYTSRYIPTQPFVRDRDGVKIGSGHLTLKEYVVHFEETGYFKAIITDDHGYSAEVEYTGRSIGLPTNLVGKAAVSDGEFKIPFKKNADNSQLELTTDSHTPMSILEMEWSGQWRKKGRRITGG